MFLDRGVCKNKQKLCSTTQLQTTKKIIKNQTDTLNASDTNYIDLIFGPESTWKEKLDAKFQLEKREQEDIQARITRIQGQVIAATSQQRMFSNNYKNNRY